MVKKDIKKLEFVPKNDNPFEGYTNEGDLMKYYYESLYPRLLESRRRDREIRNEEERRARELKIMALMRDFDNC